jgi:hypothetical protein
MASSVLGLLTQAIRSVTSPYPSNRLVAPLRDIWLLTTSRSHHVDPTGRVAIQTVEDPFYFGLFSVIAAEMQRQQGIAADAVVTRATSGAIGTGFFAWLRRSVPITWLMTTQWIRALSPLVDRVGLRSRSWAHPLADLVDVWQSRNIWRRARQRGGDFALEIDAVPVGDLIIDSFLRFRPAPRFNVHDPFVLVLIWQAHHTIRRARRYFRDSRPKLYLSSYTTYLEHGVPVRVALQEGVPVYSFGSLNCFEKRLSLNDWHHTANCESYGALFASLDRQAERRAEAANQLEKRLSGRIDAATSYMKVSAYAESATLPEGLREAVVVFLHDFYDSPHIYYDLVFSDFWQWASFTIETLERARIAYFLKPHPNQVSLSGGALAEMQAKYPMARVLPAKASNTQLADAGIACGVTVYGTVAHELAYLGIPTIGCARHPHHSFAFCHTAGNVAEYEALLLKSTRLPADREAMRRQALEFYYMHNLYGSNDDLELRQIFVTLWKRCHDPSASVGDAQSALAALRDSPAFSRRISSLLQNC